MTGLEGVVNGYLQYRPVRLGIFMHAMYDSNFSLSIRSSPDPVRPAVISLSFVLHRKAYPGLGCYLEARLYAPLQPIP